MAVLVTNGVSLCELGSTIVQDKSAHMNLIQFGMATCVSIPSAYSTWQQVDNPLCTMYLQWRNQRRPMLRSGGWVKQHAINEQHRCATRQVWCYLRVTHYPGYNTSLISLLGYTYIQLLPVWKPFNGIISWLAGFKTGWVYTKSKSGSISWCAWSKSGPAHAVDSLPLCAYGQQSFVCATKSYWKESVNTIREQG